MPIKISNDLTAEAAREVLEYNATLGLLFWKHNPKRPKEWNTRRAGKPAGCQIGGRVTVRINDRLYLSHRVIWLIVTGFWPVEELDHINGDPADNRMENLREARHGENALNRKKQSNNSSGFIGVRFRPHHRKWEGRINLGGKTVWREYFDSAQEAAAARRTALTTFHGEFAIQNPHRNTGYRRR